MKLNKTEEWHEDDGPVLFISFSTNKDGVIQGEPFETYFGSGYLDDGFDSSKWTHYVDGINWNFIFTQADPINFPELI